MIRDVNQYHQLCSFEAGLSLVLTAVGKADALQRERDDLRIPTVLAQMQMQPAQEGESEKPAIRDKMEALRSAWIESQTGVSLPVDPVQQDDETNENGPRRIIPAAARISHRPYRDQSSRGSMWWSLPAVRLPRASAKTTPDSAASAMRLGNAIAALEISPSRQTSCDGCVAPT